MAERGRTGSSGATALSADQAVAVVRIHLDRVHDAVLRTGCTPADAVDVVRATALALVERSAVEPATADEAVGRWFADARASGRQVAGRSPDLPGDDRQQALQSALDALPERQHLAVLLRDAYDLPPAAVATALDSEVASVEQLLDQARTALPAAAALRGLTVLGMTPAARSEVLRAVEDLAPRRLPQARQRGDGRRVTAAAAGPAAAAAVPDLPPTRLLSPLLAGLSVVLAVLVGVGVGLFLGRQDAPRPLAGADGELPPGVELVTPVPSVTAVPSPPTVPEVRPSTRVVVVPPSPLPTPTPSPTPTPTPVPEPTLALSPATGVNGTTVAVTGTGFAPGDQVRIDYLDADGAPTGSSAVAVADDRGSITASLVAQDPAGTAGPHSVVATVGDSPEPSARAEFTAEEEDGGEEAEALSRDAAAASPRPGS